MELRILDKFKIGSNLSISVDGNCDMLKNEVLLKDELGHDFKVISIGMVKYTSSKPAGKTTTLLITGDTNNIGNNLYY